MAVIALAAGAGLASTTAAQVCTFGIGPAVSLGLLALHADRAQLKTGDLTETKYAQTSVVPFAAFLDGRQAWSALAEELDPQNAAAAVLVAVLFSVRPSWMRFVR